MRYSRISPEFVEFIPEHLAQGVLYVSKRYSTASHLCCCGCGLKVVTPLNPAKWQLTEHNGMISLYPSVGNWSFPCKSHYWIEGNGIRWAGVMSKSEIAAVRAADQRDTELLLGTPTRGLLATARAAIVAAWRGIAGWFQR